MIRGNNISDDNIVGVVKYNNYKSREKRNCQMIIDILSMARSFPSRIHVINYINTHILCVCVSVCVCVCVSVCVSVISEISETGGRSAMQLTPTRRASPGELQQLLLEST